MPDQIPEGIERAMAVMAHPDDMEFNCGGALARLAAAGVDITLVVVTAGNRGGEGDRSEDELARVRREEQAAACKVLGIQNYENLGYDDGSVTPSLELRKDITRLLRRLRPNLVITHNAIRHYGTIGGNHPDHLAVGEATLAAVYPTARNPMALPELLQEGLEKWVVDWVWVGGAERPNHYVDITEQLEQKVEALMCHKSQLQPEVADWIRMRVAEEGQKAKERDFPAMAAAESFRQMFTGEWRRPAAFVPADENG